MRPDMAKVIVERPRVDFGRARRFDRRTLQGVSIEEWPAREGIKHRSGGGSKAPTDVLGPLRRFLRSRVGRPWDAVYSEICAQLPRRFPVREHFLLHVFQFVTRHVIEIDGVPCDGEGREYGEPLHRNPYRPFYICPRTGLLRQVPARKRRTDRRARS